MKLRLVQGPEGGPNFCFGTYDEADHPVDFVQSDYNWADLANKLGAELPDLDEVGTSKYLAAAFDWLSDHDSETFEVNE